MDGAIEALRKEFAGLRTGRASASLLDPVMVEAYGSSHAAQPMRHGERARTAHADRPGLGSRAGQAGGKGDPRRRARSQPAGRGPATVRVPIPDLNEERRNELVKVAAKYTEQARVSVRNVRRDGIETLKKHGKGRRYQPGRAAPDRRRDPGADRRLRSQKVDDAFAQKDKEILQV